MFTATSLAEYDPDVFAAIQAEQHRQEAHIELIASENYASPAVMFAQGSQLTNKYAEGYPGKRFYGGCAHVDDIERLAQERVAQLFGAEYVNVQPHSGSQANQAVYFAVLKPGDTIMGMDLAHGGHLTHGSPVNLSGKLFNVVAYGLNAQEIIDYEAMEQLALTHRPKLIIGGASAYALHFDWPRMREIADKVGAYLMVDMAHYAGLIAAGVYPNPTPFADFVTSTTHKTLRGPRGGIILAKKQHAKQLDASAFPGLQGGPLMHVIAAKAVAFKEAQQPAFKRYQQQVLVNALAIAKVLTQRGLRIVSSTTQSHMFLVDLRPKNLTGKQADKALGEAFITVNKNTIPNDPQSPWVTSGIRIGSAAITTRGFSEQEAEQTAHLIADVLEHSEDAAYIAAVRQKVQALTARFPVYRNS